MMKKERSDLLLLASAAIKASFNTRSVEGTERCLDVLKQLNSLSLSIHDILQSDSILKLETLRRHRNPRIRKEAQVLFDSWFKTLYAPAKDNSFRTGLTKLRPKGKKPLLARCLELKKIQKETTNESLGLMKRKAHTCLAREDEEIFLGQSKDQERKTDLKPLNLKRKIVACNAVALKQTQDEHHKMCSVTATPIPQPSRQNIKGKDRQASTTNFSSVFRRDHEAYKKQQETGNPKSAALKTEMAEKKKTEFLELFTAAKKAADAANAKGLLSGKAETSRCVEALSLLMKINITPKPQDSSQMVKKLNGLTHHKDRKICNAASALLHLWRQRTTDLQRKHSATKPFRTTSCKAY